MAEEIHAALEEFETKLASGEITTFHVRLTNEFEILPTAKDGSTGKVVKLKIGAELLESLHIFFFNIDCIVYNSFDYATLKSLLNAHRIFERISSTTPQKDQP